MKVGLFISISLFLLNTLYAQVIFDLPPENKTKPSRFGASFQIGIMFIDPMEVNTYIQKYVKAQIGNGIVFLHTGDETINQAVNLNFSPSIKFNNYTLRCMADFGIASKSVTINSKENRFSVMRFSPGLLLDRFFHIDDQKKFFVGAGIQYHFMSFENTPANGFGGRIESGLRFRTLEETNYSFFLMFDFANQKTPTTIASKIKSIDFSGLGIGARIEF
ncbi:MAG: hypothetical protein KF860_02150 [Cyclobacteriaceae bacterium]|nr:hypothetical protein [Cyclobacteriaceae bacterium]